jgi:hypothetical protein
MQTTKHERHSNRRTYQAHDWISPRIMMSFETQLSSLPYLSKNGPNQYANDSSSRQNYAKDQ